MKIDKGCITKAFNRDLYWFRTIFLSDDKSKRSSVLACASYEYLMDFYRIAGGTKLEQKHFDEWGDKVVKKWSALGNDIFKQDVHYDVYVDIPEGKANGLAFLRTLK